MKPGDLIKRKMDGRDWYALVLSCDPVDPSVSDYWHRNKHLDPIMSRIEPGLEGQWLEMLWLDNATYDSGWSGAFELVQSIE